MSLAGGGADKLLDDFSQEKEEQEFAYQRQMSHEELQSLRTLNTSAESRNSLSQQLGKVGKIVLVPVAFLGFWFGFFLLLVTLGAAHWFVCLLFSLLQVAQVYLPALKAKWREIGTYFVEAVRAEVEKEEEEEQKLMAQLYRRTPTCMRVTCLVYS
eukprot:COSAG05_NODE_1418_length_4940_cov_2.779384_2_plen_156_part_00